MSVRFLKKIFMEQNKENISLLYGGTDIENEMTKEMLKKFQAKFMTDENLRTPLVTLQGIPVGTKIADKFSKIEGFMNIAKYAEGLPASKFIYKYIFNCRGREVKLFKNIFGIDDRNFHLLEKFGLEQNFEIFLEKYDYRIMDSHIFEWLEHENKRIFITDKDSISIAHAVYRFGIEEVVGLAFGLYVPKVRSVSDLTNEQKLVAIELWQSLGFVHELTCRDEVHLGQGVRPSLEGIEKDGKVFLVCPKCGHIQENIPYIIFESYL